MRKNEYANLVEKLANEIVEEAADELQGAAYEEDEYPQEEINLEDLPPEVVEQIIAAVAEEEAMAEIEEEEDEEEYKMAQEVAYAAIQKAAMTIREAEAIQKAAEEAMQEANIYKEAASLVFKQYGLLK